jgi:hypothetical protein
MRPYALQGAGALLTCSATTACEGVLGLGNLSSQTADGSVGGDDAGAASDATLDADAGSACGDNGTSCGTNLVCFDGACVPCFASGSCHPDNNVCQTGTYDCSSGQQQCTWTANVGTCEGGTCCTGRCITGDNDHACGLSCRLCPSPSHCQNAKCVARYGDPDPFSGCSPSGIQISGNLFLAQRLTVGAPLSTTALGAIMSPGASSVSGILALYTDSGGVPGTLMAYTPQSTFAAGATNEFGLSNTPTLQPGTTYWLAGEFTTGAAICNDGSGSNSVEYRILPSLTNPPPISFGTATTANTANFNFYVMGTE